MLTHGNGIFIVSGDIYAILNWMKNINAILSPLVVFFVVENIYNASLIKTNPMNFSKNFIKNLI